ncbi:MAG TPA: hypothetical protein VG405_06275 [Solirubrobacteraceae bacterium]|nr:hypothetical protein [Solirubrobacteraceae bacterium]
MKARSQNATEDPGRLAELSALADGTLDPGRRAEVKAWIEASEDLRQRFADERRAVALLTAARDHERAPAALRERIESSRIRTSRGRPAWRRSPLGFTAALAVAVAVAAVLTLTLPAGGPGTPSVAQAASLGTLQPTLPAPLPRASARSQLQAVVGRLHFPNWSSTIGWRATGQRRDRLDGRSMLTVFYTKDDHTVAYTIVAGAPLPLPSGTSTSGAVYSFQFFRLHGRNVVTWREGGHTCLLSSARLSGRTLAALTAIA